MQNVKISVKKKIKRFSMEVLFDGCEENFNLQQ